MGAYWIDVGELSVGRSCKVMCIHAVQVVGNRCPCKYRVKDSLEALAIIISRVQGEHGRFQGELAFLLFPSSHPS
jgi:hypothetical protein